MNSKTIPLLIAAIILFAGCLGQETAPANQGNQTSNVTLVTLAVSINNGTAAYGRTVTLPKGSTAYDAFRAVANLSVKQYSFGVLVTGIDGLEQNAATNRYWQYYVDGVLAPVGVDSLVLNESVRELEFRYETPPETG